MYNFRCISDKLTIVKIFFSFFDQFYKTYICSTTALMFWQCRMYRLSWGRPPNSSGVIGTSFGIGELVQATITRYCIPTFELAVIRIPLEFRTFITC